MKQRSYMGIYITILLLFIALCVLSVLQLFKSSKMESDIKAIHNNNTSQVDVLKKKQTELESQLSSQTQANSDLSSQLSSLQSNINNLQSQVSSLK